MPNRARPVLSLSIFALAAVLGVVVLSQARAAPMPVVEALRSIPAAPGAAYSDSFSMDCTTTAAVIKPTGGFAQGTQPLSYTCQNDSTTKVAVGDSAIGDPTDSRNSPLHCATNCASMEWHGNIRQEYCRADTGTVTVYCRAQVPTTSAP